MFDTPQQLALLALPPRSKLRPGARGNYIWLTQVDRLHERVMLRLLMVSTLLVVLVSGLIIGAITYFDSGFAAALAFLIRYLLIGFVLAVAVSLILFYFFYVPLTGRRHHILFDLREDGILQVSMDKTAHRSDIRFDIATLATAPDDSPATQGAGLRTRRRQRFIRFEDVKKVVLRRDMGVIRLVCRDMSQCRVYPTRQDYGFVSAYIQMHCTGVKFVDK